MKNQNLSFKIAVSIALLLLLTLGISGCPHNKIRTERFVDWCTNKGSLRAETRHTVEVLLKEVGTQDCHQGEIRLNNLEKLDLFGGRTITIRTIKDLEPLSALTNLKELNVQYSKIKDIKPLSALTNLEKLNLSNNRIRDLKPLSRLTNLEKLYLSHNRIRDLILNPVMKTHL